MAWRDCRTLAEVHSTEVSKQAISLITDKVIDGDGFGGNRLLDSVYPVAFIDAVHVKSETLRSRS